MSRPKEIAVFAPHRHPRLRYVLYQLSDWWGVRLRLFTDRAAYLVHPALARINYGAAPSGQVELLLAAHPLLSGGDFILANKPARLGARSDGVARLDFSGCSGLPAFCFVNEDDFDPLALIFFCISRYEEYQNTPKDEHGRFPATQSHALANDYLERPIVNEHLQRLAHQLELLFPDCQLQLPPYRLQLTYDVDIPYAYRLRGWRGLASGIKDLISGHPRRALHRFQTLLTSRQDPYDVFDWLEQLHQKHQLKPRFFWLLAQQNSRFDPNPDPSTPALRKLIQEIAARADIGIHPSYHSSDRPDLFAAERATLKAIVGQYVEHSRQHFLRFNLPATYRQLLLAGLRHDHSMGYADRVGFRAGTNLPFYWYDLEREEKTYLRVYPFAAMDVSLLRYHQLGYFASQKKILELAQTVKETGGPFTLLWHNSSFAPEYGWAGWREMYEDLIEDLQPN